MMLDYRLMASKKSAYLDRLGEIDRVLAAMREDGTIRRLYLKYGMQNAP